MKIRVNFDPTVDYYKIAGLSDKATDAEIEKAYDDRQIEFEKEKQILISKYNQAVQYKNIDEMNRLSSELCKAEDKFAKVDHAFKVLIYNREKYDKKRYKKIDVPQYEYFDVTQDYYANLDVRRKKANESNEEYSKYIFNAYNTRNISIQTDPNWSDEDKRIHLDILAKAFYVLFNEKIREEYDKARAEFLKNQRAVVVSQSEPIRVVDEEEADEKTLKKANAIIIIIGLAALLAVGHFAGKAISDAFKKAEINRQPVIEQDDPNYTDEDKDVIVDDEPEDKVDNTVDVKVNYYGDINDEKLVTERANAIVNQFNNNGMINVYTGGSYTVDEIKKVMGYVTGTYQPVSEEDALMATDSYLNFAIAPGNSEHVIYQVNYLGGEESFKPALDKMNASYQPLCLVDNMIFGDCTAYPYLKWIENNYNKMVTTTDREECNRIFEETTQSIVELTCGRGYELDGVLYTMNDFTGLDKINAGNILQIYVFNYQVFRTNLAKDDYSFNNTLLGLDNETNLATYKYDDVMVFYNALCDSTGLKQTIKVDDSGEIILVNPDNQHANFSEVNQMNTVNTLLQNYYLSVKTVDNAKSLN